MLNAVHERSEIGKAAIKSGTGTESELGTVMPSALDVNAEVTAIRTDPAEKMERERLEA